MRIQRFAIFSALSALSLLVAAYPVQSIPATKEIARQQSNIELHKQGHEAFARGDMGTLGSLIAEDAVWHWPGKSQISGDHRGRSAVLQQFRRMAELTGGNMQLEAQDYLANGSKTAAIIRFTATRGDKQLEVQGVEVAEWRDGKVVEEWLFFDDLYAYDEFWP